MNTGTPQLITTPLQSATPRSIAQVRRAAGPEERPTWIEMFSERAAIIGAPAFYGPPVISVLGPWLVLVLVLVGPFALILTLLVALALTTGLLALFVALLASPYLLIRHLRAPGTVLAKRRAPRPLFNQHRADARRLGSPQTKGMQ